MADVTNQVIEREIRIDASPETVFGFLTDPERHVRWMGIAVTLEPHPGGAYRIDMNGDDVILGKFIAVEPYSRVVVSFGWEAGGTDLKPGASTVEYTCTPDGAGTILRMVHRDLPADQLPPHSQGWDHFLPRLVAVAAGRDPDATETTETTEASEA